jgi:tRNA dimethylallyltransferase
VSESLITILGPTAVGKTKFGVNLAYKYNGEIISADSRQVYKFMNIGTGKDLSDYNIGNKSIPFHLIDIIDPAEEYDMYKFRRDFMNAYLKIIERKKMPFLVGGTGLYIHSVLKGYDLSDASFDGQRFEELQNMDSEDLIRLLKSLNEELHNTTDLLDRERTIRAIMIEEAGKKNSADTFPQFDPLVLGIATEREELKSKITGRLKIRLEEGMVDEAKDLLERGISHDKLRFFGLEYKYLSMYLKGELNYNDMFQKLNSSIHKFAKRQMTWFRKMEKEGIKIHWLEPDDTDKACSLVDEYLNIRIS